MDSSYRHVLAVVKNGSFSGAARELHVSQPALSMSVKFLENRLGGEIFVRSRSGTKLTEFGKLVHDRLVAVQVSDRNLDRAVVKYLKQTDRLALGLIDSVAFGMIGQIDIDPAKLRLLVDNTANISELVATAQIDVGYVTKPAKLRRDLVYKNVGKEQMVAVASEDYKDQMPLRLLAYNLHSNTHNLIMHALTCAGVNVLPVFYSTDPHLLIEAARQGRGVAVVPKSLYEGSIKQGLKIVLQNVMIERPIVRVARRDRLLPRQLADIEPKLINLLGAK